MRCCLARLTLAALAMINFCLAFKVRTRMRSAVLERPRHSMPFLYALQDDDSTEISDIETTESITSNSLQLGEPEGESNSTLEEVLSAAGLTVSTKANTLTNTPQDKEMEKCDNHYPTAASKKRKTVWEHYARTRNHAPKTNGITIRVAAETVA